MEVKILKLTISAVIVVAGVILMLHFGLLGTEETTCFNESRWTMYEGTRMGSEVLYAIKDLEKRGTYVELSGYMFCADKNGKNKSSGECAKERAIASNQAMASNSKIPFIYYGAKYNGKIIRDDKSGEIRGLTFELISE